MTDEHFLTALTRSITRGIVQGLGDELRAYMASSPEPDCPAPTYVPRDKTLEEIAAVGMPRVPDIAPQGEEIDLLARMKQAVHEGDVDLADVAMVEEVLRRQAFDRAQAEVAAMKADGTRRVNAPDS
jgi:hypothetical protein